MNCPSCKSEIKYFKRMYFSRDHNVEDGFKCPTCNALLVADSTEKVKVSVFVTLIAMIILFKLLSIAADKFFDPYSYWSIVAIGIPAALFVIAIPYLIFRNVELKEKEIITEEDLKN